jgi:hypothetical protein
MDRKSLYLALCVIGVVIPYWQFLPWILQNGLDVRLFLAQAGANRVSATFVADVLVSAVVVIAFMRSEAARVKVAHRWMPVAGLCLVGVSLALPLYLYLRERALEAGAAEGAEQAPPLRRG